MRGGGGGFVLKKILVLFFLSNSLPVLSNIRFKAVLHL